ncbi:MAG: hypothetical protein HY401_02200 [Elusimicrobia bacterium]|nr:hypothetical protein [Elusimicrobiota bacterium]
MQGYGIQDTGYRKIKGILPLLFYLSTVYCLLSTSLISCTKKQAAAARLPDIPPRALSEPSSLAYDSQNFYVADWTGNAVLKIDPNGQTDLLKLGRARPIQVVAIAKEKLIIETNDGKLHLWQPGTNPKALAHQFERKPGSSMCWDGIYLWLTNEGKIFPSFLLGGAELIEMPERSRRSVAFLDQTAGAAVALSCGQGKFQALIKEENDYAIINNILEPKAMTKTPWSNQTFRPVAMARLGDGRMAVLAQSEQKTGMFKLFELPL